MGIGIFEYSNKIGIRIMNDLKDGYYPHILRDKYPNGVYFDLTNRL